jgi:hypothetical protein
MSLASPNPDYIYNEELGQADEPELAPIICVACGKEIEWGEEPYPVRCYACHEPIDLPSQMAFSRGSDAFAEGQELLFFVSPKRRRRSITTPEEMEGLHYYMQAYSSLQLALQGKVADQQFQQAAQMMAAMANVFLQHGSVSPLESAYWGSLVKESNTHKEWIEVGEKISAVKPGAFTWLKRLRWRLRKHQLKKALIDLDQKITKLERYMKFAEQSSFRRKKTLF